MVYDPTENDEEENVGESPPWNAVPAGQSVQTPVPVTLKLRANAG